MLNKLSSLAAALSVAKVIEVVAFNSVTLCKFAALLKPDLDAQLIRQACLAKALA